MAYHCVHYANMDSPFGRLCPDGQAFSMDQSSHRGRYTLGSYKMTHASTYRDKWAEIFTKVGHWNVLKGFTSILSTVQS